MNVFSKLQQRTALQHLGFWCLVFAFYLMANWENYSDTFEILFTFSFRLIFQIIAAYVLLLIIFPRYKRNANKVEFALWTSLLLIILHTIYRIIKINYFEVVYPETYEYCYTRYAGWSLTDRLLNMNGLIFKAPIIHFLPALFLIAWQYFEKQQKILAINEQKKSAELSLLRSQMNPHFLFNTLNNLYALALKKSDKTPEVISKLSEILDYTLYGCNEKYVSISKEVELIENYLALEAVRYSDRVRVSFKTDIQAEVKVAPLLFLTFLENAFKHGVAPELHQAEIVINLATTDKEIVFFIKNSIPNNYVTNKEATGIGLQNVKKQLDLLYPNAYTLKMVEEEDNFKVHLNIKTQ